MLLPWDKERKRNDCLSLPKGEVSNYRICGNPTWVLESINTPGVCCKLCRTRWTHSNDWTHKLETYLGTCTLLDVMALYLIEASFQRNHHLLLFKFTWYVHLDSSQRKSRDRPDVAFRTSIIAKAGYMYTCWIPLQAKADLHHCHMGGWVISGGRCLLQHFKNTDSSSLLIIPQVTAIQANIFYTENASQPKSSTRKGKAWWHQRHKNYRLNMFLKA